MEELTKYKLGEIAKIYNGSTPSTLDASNYDGDIIWATPKDLSDQNSKYFSKGARNITQKGFDSCSTQMIPANNILMSSRAPIGLFAINTVDCCTNQGFKNIVLDKAIADVDFMYYFLKYHVKEIEALGSGTTFREVSKTAFEKYEISIPSLPTQQKIASVLSKLDRKISVNREINRNLEELAKQIYDYWFVQFDFPNEEGKPYKSSGGKMVWNETLKREIPAGWKNGVLSNIAYITMGQSPEGSSYNEDGIGTIFYQGSTDFGIRFPNVRMYTTKPTRFAKIGDILMSVRAPVGAMNIANSDCCIGRGLSAMNSKIGSITHLYYTMDYFRHTFENKNAVGTTFGSITKDELYNLPVVIPSKEVISAFNVKTIYIFNQQLSTSKEIQELTALRDSLLPLLMNGQVTLNSCLFTHGILFFVKFTIWEVKEYVTWMLKCRYYKVFNHNFVNLWTMNR